MYEVSCPHCGHVVRTAFAREGAAVNCAKCDQRFKITASRVQHLVTPAAASGRSLMAMVKELAGPEDPAPRAATEKPAAPAGKTPARPRSAPATNDAAVTTSPTRSPSKSADTPPRPQAPASIPPSQALSELTGESSGTLPRTPHLPRVETASHRKRRRNRRVMFAMGVLTGVLVAVLVVVINLAMSETSPHIDLSVTKNVRRDAAPTATVIADPMPETNDQQASSEPASDDNHAAWSDHDVIGELEMAQSLSLAPSSWQHIRVPWTDDQENTGPLRVTDEGTRTNDAGQMVLLVTITTDSFELYESCQATFFLVDPQNTAYASITVPVALVSASNSTTLALPISHDLFDRMDRLTWRTDTGDLISNAVMINTVRERHVQDADHLTVRISIENDVRRKLRRSIVVIQAFDHQRISAGLWRLDRAVPLGPGDTDTFATRLPLKVQADELQVTALGVTDGP